MRRGESIRRRLERDLRRRRGCSEFLLLLEVFAAGLDGHSHADLGLLLGGGLAGFDIIDKFITYLELVHLCCERQLHWWCYPLLQQAA